MTICRRKSVAAFACAALVAWAVPATAQFQPVGEAPLAERYNIEGAAALWNPNPTLVISSESLGIQGDTIDLVSDLGIEQKRLRELRLVLRPAPKHKFRFSYLPIKYDAEAVVQREFTFNAQRYRVGVPVNTTADLTTYRFGYEFDFLYRDWGYVGVLLDVKYTNVSIALESPIGSEFTEQVAPIPTIGVVGRGYLVPNVSITGELSFFKVPEDVSEQLSGGGRYLDYDFYGTVNFNRFVGAQLGVRSIDVEYFHDLDAGSLSFTGWYFGGVIRY